MWALDKNLAKSEGYIIRLIILFVMTSVILFLLLTLFLLVPRIDKAFDALQTESEKAAVKVYSSHLEQYIKDRELAIRDIANNRFVTSSVLLSEGDNPAFQDYISHVLLLGEDPKLTVLDVSADILFSEITEPDAYQWAESLLSENNVDTKKLNVVIDNNMQWFDLAVPIYYGRGIEGVLVARFDASPSTVYQSDAELGNSSAVSYGKGNSVIRSDHNAMVLPSEQSLTIKTYGLLFSHTESRENAEAQRAAFLKDLIFSVLIGSLIIFLLLFLLGKKIIIQPYVQLVKTRELLVKREREVNASLSFQSLIFESIPDLAFVKDEDFVIVQANQAFLNVYPESMRDSVIGTTSIEGFDPEEAEEFLKYDREAFKDGFSQTEETILFPDGHERTLITKKTRFQDVHGKRFILGLARDITDIKNAEKNLIQANAELEEFAYRTSHDLRSPLVSSLGLLELANKKIEKNDLDMAKKSLNIAQRSLTTLDNLVVDILELTKTKNNDEEGVVVNLAELVADAVEKLSQMQGFNEICFKINVDETLEFKVKRSRLVLIIENLISNAIKYSDLENEDPSVHVESVVKGRFVHFSVSDNGLGIPENQHGKLFSMFKRFHPKTSFGSGLGLYMVKKSADILGGDIEYKPLKSGSCFVLIFPVVRP
ncbi:MAG: sensor histidine kinase [Cellvibrionaceae bacterium]